MRGSERLAAAAWQGAALNKEGKLVDAQGDVVDAGLADKGLSIISNRYNVLAVETFHT